MVSSLQIWTGTYARPKLKESLPTTPGNLKNPQKYMSMK